MGNEDQFGEGSRVLLTEVGVRRKKTPSETASVGKISCS